MDLDDSTSMGASVSNFVRLASRVPVTMMESPRSISDAAGILSCATANAHAENCSAIIALPARNFMMVPKGLVDIML